MDTKNVLQLPIEDIIPNRFQPRLAFDDASLNELSASIKEHGVIQPIIVRRLNDKYEIVAGERRYRASKLAGLISVPAIITEMNDNKSAEVAIVENVQRKDLTAIEEAKSYKVLLDQNFMSQEDLARKMGLSQSSISNKLRLLTLHEDVQDAILNERISERHARSLLKLKNPEEQKNILKRIIESRLTVKQLEEEIKELIGPEVVQVKEEKGDDVFNNPLVSKDKPNYPNKFFNFLESEEVNMSTDASLSNVTPVVEEEIEMLDDFDITPPVVNVEPVSVVINPVINEIKDFISKYPDLVITESDEDGNNILTIKIPK